MRIPGDFYFSPLIYSTTSLKVCSFTDQAKPVLPAVTDQCFCCFVVVFWLGFLMPPFFPK